MPIRDALKIQVIEDEPKTAASLKRDLEENGFVAEVAADGKAGAAMARHGRYALVILDVMLSGQDGWSVLHELRGRRNGVPVLFLTARYGVPDRVRGLELGTDDYLVKPFAFSELLACLRTVPRRGNRGARQPATLRVADLEIDAERHKANRLSREVTSVAGRRTEPPCWSGSPALHQKPAFVACAGLAAARAWPSSACETASGALLLAPVMGGPVTPWLQAASAVTAASRAIRDTCRIMMLNLSLWSLF